MSSSTSTSNPSHLLINRNPPLPAHPQLFSQSTSRHSASSHSVPNLPDAGVPGVALPPVRSSLDRTYTREEGEDGYDYGYEEDEAEVDVHSTFSRDSQLRGGVKVVVGRNEFWCHKEILWFASPFFQGLLAGKSVPPHNPHLGN